MLPPIDISQLSPHKKLFQITVDCFDRPVTNCSHYFLSHFHSDHYTRLTKSFEFPVYCSKTTAALVASRIGSKAIGLEMYTTYDMGTFHVKLIEANHCPGAVLFIFLINSQFYLHTGDFRFHPNFHKFDIQFKKVYLDNTYENFMDFPTQKEAISKLLTVFDQKNTLCPLNICVLCCSYCVGKEKIFLTIGEYLDKQIQVTEDKMSIYQLYDEYTVNKLNSEVMEIVNEKRATEKTYGFLKKLKLKTKIKTMEKKKLKSKTDSFTLMSKTVIQNRTEELNILEKAGNLEMKIFEKSSLFNSPISIKDTDKYKADCNSSIDFEDFTKDSFKDSFDFEDSVNSVQLTPFDRLTTEEAPIKVISMNQLQTFDTSKIFADKIYIVCGTGWKEKTIHKNFKRLDGKLIKQGIEIIYFRYSEHSSANELKEFQRVNKIENIQNTVNNVDEFNDF